MWLSCCSYTAQTWELVPDLLLVLEPRGSGSSKGSYSQSVSTDLSSDPTVTPCLGQSELFTHKMHSLSRAIPEATQSSHVGALVEWPRNDELRINEGNLDGLENLQRTYLKAKDCSFQSSIRQLCLVPETETSSPPARLYESKTVEMLSKNESPRSFPFVRFHLEILFHHIQTSGRCHRTKLQIPDGKLSFRD